MNNLIVKRLFPQGLRDQDLYSKVSEITQYVLDAAVEDFKDTSDKHTDPFTASDERIDAIIKESGYEYINNLASTITGVDKQILTQFLSLISFYKGHRDGLELILTLLGFGFEITEWWEELPPATPMTFKMTIFVNLSQVTNLFDTIAKLRIFTKEYVFPLFDIADVVFDLDFAETNYLVSGFVDRQSNIIIEEVL